MQFFAIEGRIRGAKISLHGVREEFRERLGKKLIQRGNSMLDTLEQLRRRLLLGTLPPHVLLDLGRQLSIQKQTVMDPKLNAINLPLYEPARKSLPH